MLCCTNEPVPYPHRREKKREEERRGEKKREEERRVRRAHTLFSFSLTLYKPTEKSVGDFTKPKREKEGKSKKQLYVSWLFCDWPWAGSWKKSYTPVPKLFTRERGLPSNVRLPSNEYNWPFIIDLIRFDLSLSLSLSLTHTQTCTWFK